MASSAASIASSISSNSPIKFFEKASFSCGLVWLQERALFCRQVYRKPAVSLFSSNSLRFNLLTYSSLIYLFNCQISRSDPHRFYILKIKMAPAGIHNITLILLDLLCTIEMGDEVEFNFEYHLTGERTHRSYAGKIPR